MHIPEILKLIASHLDNESLVSATQVSQFWYTCFAPLVWSTISTSDWILPQFNPRQVFTHGHWVRSLEWHSIQSQQQWPFLFMMNSNNSTPPPYSSSSSPYLSSPSPPSLGMEQDLKGKNKRKDDQEHDHDHDYGVALRSMMRVMHQVPQESGARLSIRCLNHIIERCANLQVLKLNLGSRIGTGGGGVGEQDYQQGIITEEMIQTIRYLTFLQELELVVHAVLFPPKEEQEQEGREVAGGPQLGGAGIERGYRGKRDQLHLEVQGYTTTGPGCTTTTTATAAGTGRVLTRRLNVQSLIQDLNQLHSLVLRGSAFSFDETCFSPSSSTSTTTSRAKRTTFPLHHLSLEPAAASLTETALTILLQQCPHLESLDLPGGLAWEISDPFIKTLSMLCPNLSSYSINASSSILRAQDLIPSTAPTVNMTDLTDATETVTMPTLFSFSTSATTNQRIIPEDERLASLIRGLSQERQQGEPSFLRRFGARSCFFGNASLEALQETCPDLEHLEIPLTRSSCHHGWYVLPGAGHPPQATLLSKTRLVHYLRSLSRLKAIVAEGVWVDLTDLIALPLPTPRIIPEEQEQGQEGNEELTTPNTTTSNDLPPTGSPGHLPQVPTFTILPWACTHTLTRLDLGFSFSSSSPLPIPTLTSSLASSILYKFLSNFKSLQILRISYTVLTEIQPPSPSSSSCFYLLSNLKDLREFDIETCSYPPNTLFNKETLQWIVSEQCWPKLEKLTCHRSGTSQERELWNWLRQVGKESLLVNGVSGRRRKVYKNQMSTGLDSNSNNSNGEGMLSTAMVMQMMMTY